MIRRHTALLTLVILLQIPRVPSTMEFIDSLQRKYREGVARELRSVATARLEERRVIQRRVYGMLLEDLVRQDGLGALLTYLRGTLLLQFAIPRDTLWIVPPNTPLAIPGVALEEDRAFPEDPWRRGSPP